MKTKGRKTLLQVLIMVSISISVQQDIQNTLPTAECKTDGAHKCGVILSLFWKHKYQQLHEGTSKIYLDLYLLNKLLSSWEQFLSREFTMLHKCQRTTAHIHIWKSKYQVSHQPVAEGHTAALHSDSYKDSDSPALLVILDKSFILQWLLYWLLHHWKSLCQNRVFISELWKRGEDACFLENENSAHQSYIQTLYTKYSEFRLPSTKNISKECLKYCIRNELSMKFIYLQIPTLFLASSDILPDTQNFPCCICLKHISYKRFVDHALKEVPRFSIKILSIKRFFGRQDALCC